MKYPYGKKEPVKFDRLFLEWGWGDSNPHGGLLQRIFVPLRLLPHRRTIGCTVLRALWSGLYLDLGALLL